MTWESTGVWWKSAIEDMAACVQGGRTAISSGMRRRVVTNELGCPARTLPREQVKVLGRGDYAFGKPSCRLTCTMRCCHHTDDAKTCSCTESYPRNEGGTDQQ